MASETERIIAEFRASAYKNATGTIGTMARALVDCADQRDALLAACEALVWVADNMETAPIAASARLETGYRQARIAIAMARGGAPDDEPQDADSHRAGITRDWRQDGRPWMDSLDEAAARGEDLGPDDDYDPQF